MHRLWRVSALVAVGLATSAIAVEKREEESQKETMTLKAITEDGQPAVQIAVGDFVMVMSQLELKSKSGKVNSTVVSKDGKLLMDGSIPGSKVSAKEMTFSLYGF